MLPHQHRKGFTLIELLIVVVIVGILAAVAIPKFQDTKGRSLATAIKSDLKNLSTLQEDYFITNGVYAPDATTAGFSSSGGVTITVVESNPSGWSASATHPNATPFMCAVYYGNVSPLSPATREGTIACTN